MPQGLVRDPEILGSLFWRVQTKRSPPADTSSLLPIEGRQACPSLHMANASTASPSPGPGASNCLEVEGFVYKAKQGVCGDGGCREVLENVT